MVWCVQPNIGEGMVWCVQPNIGEGMVWCVQPNIGEGMVWCVQPYGRTHHEPGPGCGVPGRRRESLWPLGTWRTASPPSDLQHHRKEQMINKTSKVHIHILLHRACLHTVYMYILSLHTSPMCKDFNFCSTVKWVVALNATTHFTVEQKLKLWWLFLSVRIE